MINWGHAPAIHKCHAVVALTAGWVITRREIMASLTRRREASSNLLCASHFLHAAQLSKGYMGGTRPPGLFLFRPFLQWYFLQQCGNTSLSLTFCLAQRILTLAKEMRFTSTRNIRHQNELQPRAIIPAFLSRCVSSGGEVDPIVAVIVPIAAANSSRRREKAPGFSERPASCPRSFVSLNTSCSK